MQNVLQFDPMYNFAPASNSTSILGKFLDSVTDIGSTYVDAYFKDKAIKRNLELYEKSNLGGPPVKAGEPAPIYASASPPAMGGLRPEMLLLILGALGVIVVLKK